MLIHLLFFLLIALALLGDARIFLFVMNRAVFGNHRQEKSPWGFLLYSVPPLLLFLTALFWPLHRWLRSLMSIDVMERFTPEPVERLVGSAVLVRIGTGWLLLAAAVGVYWIVDRLWRRLRHDPQPAGTRTLEGEVVRLRKAHVPFAFLRKLGAHNDVYDLEITRHEIAISDLPPQFDGFRIAFLTDTHVAAFVRRDFYRTIVEKTNAFDPDIVLLGGDFVTFRRDIPLMAEVLLTDLRAREGVFAVLGNHDYWAGGERVREAMSARGVRFVINASVQLQRDGAVLPLVGVDEVYRGWPDVEHAFERAPAGPLIALTHHPDMVDLLGDRRIDLLLCGHTHGGQICFPFFGAVVVPSKHEDRYAAGFRRVDKVLLYVSRGIGAVPPLRILCRPEIATFTLRRGTAE